MTGRSFVDTNVFVYAADLSAQERSKHDIAETLIAQSSADLVVSTQVLQEFYVVITRKLRLPMTEDQATAAVREMARLEVVQLDAPSSSPRSTPAGRWDCPSGTLSPSRRRAMPGATESSPKIYRTGR